MHRKMRAVLSELHAELGWKSRLASGLGGRWVLGRLRQEEQRLNAGQTREPPTFYERNAACQDNPRAALARAVDATAPEASPSALGDLLPSPHGPLVPVP